MCLVGPVGCGKTTLAKSLGRTIEIPDNQLFLDEIDVKNLKLSDLRKNISIVPQEAFLFTSTISENLRFGEPKASYELVKESATNIFKSGFTTLTIFVTSSIKFLLVCIRPAVSNRTTSTWWFLAKAIASRPTAAGSAPYL